MGATLISNAPLMIFGGFWVHQRFNPNMWPSTLGLGGIHRGKFLAFGFTQALILPIFYRISVSSGVLNETMTQYGFKYPADKQVRKLITTAMKSIHDDRENSKDLGVDPTVMNQHNLSQPIQTSPDSSQTRFTDSSQTPPPRNTSDNFKASEMYQNQNSFKITRTRINITHNKVTRSTRIGLIRQLTKEFRTRKIRHQMDGRRSIKVGMISEINDSGVS